MNLLERIRLRENEAIAELRGENEQLNLSVDYMRESLADLELQLEDAEWTRLSFESGQEFSREGLKRICALSRLYFLKNPLINRAVTLQSMYVWAQGVSIQGSSPLIDGVVQAFLDDEQNKAELFGHQARSMKEQDLQVTGNLFFSLFTHLSTGRVRISSIPVDEITDIITNPQNRKEPWYYKRVWTPQTLSVDSGVVAAEGTKTAYYPDWKYTPDALSKPKRIGGHPVMWDAPVYHVKVGGLSDMRFGVPETYSGLDWAKAYKDFLEDWATIVRAYSRFAFKATTPGGKKGVAAAKAKLGTTVSTGTGRAETNPPPVAGSTLVAPEGFKLDPIKTAGATTKAEDGRRMLLMVCAATGLPETFFGDVSVGTLATANSLDRPTELKFRDRQELWKSIVAGLIDYVIDKRALAPGYSALKGSKVLNDEKDGWLVALANDPDTGEPIDRHVNIDFPSILEHDGGEEVKSIIAAATLEGKTLAGTIDQKTVSRLLLTALGQDDIDDLLDLIYPEDGEEPAPTTQAEESLMEAVSILREAVASGAFTT